MEDARFGNKLRSAMESLVTSAMINNAVEEQMQQYLAALAVDAADRAVKIIASRLDKGADE
jgi:predicted kinase